jgi:hypothetical protein
MTILITISLIAVTYAYYWYKKNIFIDALRKRKKSTAKSLRSAKPTPAKQAFKCVVIHADENACWSAKNMVNKPILFDDAGPLPLKNCDAQSCHCGYIRYDDRRIAARRRNLSAAEYFISYSKNRRNRQDRRQSTLAPN